KKLGADAAAYRSGPGARRREGIWSRRLRWWRRGFMSAAPARGSSNLRTAGHHLKISIVIPAHNEEPNIHVLVSRILSALPVKYEYELVLVDDGSSDNTLAAIKVCAQN